jgi:tRNA dimethylallyltransferase
VVALLFGPTASGKSGLAVAVAQALGADIVNADSRQLYQRLPILAAVPPMAERGEVPHHLYETTPPTVAVSAAEWAAEAARVIDGIHARGRRALVVGGTGMYLDVLANGISPIPPVPDAVRHAVDADLAAKGLPFLHAELERTDPDLARRLPPGDTQRIVRGVCVQRATGTALSVWQQQLRTGGYPARFVRWALCPVREVVYARIHARFEAMLVAGLLAEVAALADLPDTAPGLTSLGTAALRAHLNGALTLPEARDDLLQQTRHYAKRQTTWLRNSYQPDMLVADTTPATVQALVRHFLAAEEAP